MKNIPDSTHFKYIDAAIMTKGEVSVIELMEYFKISRTTASQIIGRYRRKHPENLKYNRSIKRYVPHKFCSNYFDINARALVFLVSLKDVLTE